mmetsp:Transcript_13507/g.29145  ORF Transcript_13507/g.29145 Transcript_13507/m.29145 type:complete len:240 (-) Transcript_13507:455-1174(-)
MRHGPHCHLGIFGIRSCTTMPHMPQEPQVRTPLSGVSHKPMPLVVPLVPFPMPLPSRATPGRTVLWVSPLDWTLEGTRRSKMELCCCGDAEEATGVTPSVSMVSRIVATRLRASDCTAPSSSMLCECGMWLMLSNRCSSELAMSSTDGNPGSPLCSGSAGPTAARLGKDCSGGGAIMVRCLFTPWSGRDWSVGLSAWLSSPWPWQWAWGSRSCSVTRYVSGSFCSSRKARGERYRGLSS